MAFIRDGSLHDRRRGADSIIKTINFITIVCYLLAMLAVYFLVNAAPSMDSMISTFAGTTFEKARAVELSAFRLSWMYRFLFTLFLIAGLSGIGIYLKTQRVRRKNDHHYVSLIFFCGLATLLIPIVIFGAIL